MTPLQSDDLLSRCLGSSLQSATFRLIAGVVIVSVIGALIVQVI